MVLPYIYLCLTVLNEQAREINRKKKFRGNIADSRDILIFEKQQSLISSVIKGKTNKKKIKLEQNTIKKRIIKNRSSWKSIR